MCGPASDLRPIGVDVSAGRELSSLYALIDYHALPEGDCGALARSVQLDALGDLKPMMMAAAIVGPVFTLEVLAWLVEMKPQRLLPAIAAACAQGLIDAERSACGVDRYVFLDAGLQAFAYEMVPAQDRVRLHQRIAEALRQSRAEACANPPEQVARHHRFADDPIQSKRWLGKAAWQAIASEDTDRAIGHLEEALAQDGDVLHTSAVNRVLLQLLGVQLAIAEGNGSDAVLGAYQRSIMSAGKLPRRISRQEMRSLWIAQSCHLVKGEVRTALAIGHLLVNHLKRRAHQSKNVLGSRILVHRMYALSLMLSGHLQQALEHYDVAIADYDAVRHGILRFAWGSDQAALAHAHYAWTHALAGNTPAVLVAINRARKACDQFDHAHTTAHALSVVAIAALTVDANDEAFFAAREARAIAIEHQFPYWTAWADVILAAIDVRASPRTAFAKLDAAHLSYQKTGAAQLSPAVHALLSAAALRSNRAAQGLEQANAGLALAADNGCVLYRPELLRQRARALFALGKDKDATHALEVGYGEAMRSGATLFTRKIARDGVAQSTGKHKSYWYARYLDPN